MGRGVILMGSGFEPDPLQRDFSVRSWALGKISAEIVLHLFPLLTKPLPISIFIISYPTRVRGSKNILQL